jgi:mannose-6-phosphate isomerase-like protein (cupin superfamily)
VATTVASLLSSNLGSCWAHAPSASLAPLIASPTVNGRGSSPQGYRVVDPAQVANWHEGTDVPGDYRPLTEALDARQLAVTFAEVPPHTDFERGVGHFHKELEEIYLVSRGTLTMRCGEDVMHISAPTAVRVDPNTPRSYRNEGDDRVEMWVVSRLLGYSDSIKVPEFWSASSAAARRNR